jgi:hypothetical protein
MSDADLSPDRFADAFLDFLEAVNRGASAPGDSLADRIQAHLGIDPASLQVVTEQVDPYEHPNVQVALDSYLAQVDPDASWIGIAGEQKQYVTSAIGMIIGETRHRVGSGPVDHVSVRLARGQVLSCVQHGLLLFHDGQAPLVLALLGPSTMHGPRQQVQVEVLAADPVRARSFLDEIRERMRRLNVYRGQVISIDPGRLDMGAQPLVAFHDLPRIERDDVVLPDDLLARIERHTVVFANHAAALQAAGRSLKRGMLLHGTPGTGKTLTLMYLIGQMPGRTVLLVTGVGMGLLRIAIQMARTLAPSMVVLEDVDLIAQDRGDPFNPGGRLLFELLNELDGLGNDIDVIFALTSNRPAALESALAARPGRIDLAVEFPLPGLDARVRLLELYARGLSLEDVDLVSVADAIDGASPAYIKELLRRAAVLAATGGAVHAVTTAHLDQARDELAAGGALGQSLLGFRRDHEPNGFGTFPGFPEGMPPMR